MVASLDTDIKQKMGKLQAAMKEAADGKALKRELSKRLRGIAQPTEQRMRQMVLKLPSKGHPGPSMRQAIARQTKAATRWSGDSMGVSIKQRARSMPRGFNMAGRAFNRAEGWNPTTLGGETIHQDIRPAQWFDSQTVGVAPDAQRAILTALEDAAATIASRAS
jgi:hypothetical protein